MEIFMKKEFDDYLVKRYPQLFRERNGNPSTTSMNWGFQCQDGWFNLINQLCLSIENHIKSMEHNNIFIQKQLDLAAANKMDEMFEIMRTQYEKGELKIKKIPDVIVNEVKEKMGQLSFSVKGADDEIHGMIRMATSMSSKICEECGKPGQLSTTKSGWLRVLCKEHDQKEKTEIGIKSNIEALAYGELINLEVIKVINQQECIGVKNHDWFSTNPKDKNKPKEYFKAKYIEDEIYSFWNAEPVDTQ
jgi:formylmethanofuran dehydrogenase subunit E